MEVGDVEVVSDVIYPIDSGKPYTLSIVSAEFSEELPDGSDVMRKMELSRSYDGLLGDANLTGKISADDAAEVLLYAASRGAGAEILPDPAEDPALGELRIRLADTDGNGVINAVDAANILVYAAVEGAQGKADWDEILSA